MQRRYQVLTDAVVSRNSRLACPLASLKDMREGLCRRAGIAQWGRVGPSAGCTRRSVNQVTFQLDAVNKTARLKGRYHLPSTCLHSPCRGSRTGLDRPPMYAGHAPWLVGSCSVSYRASKYGKRIRPESHITLEGWELGDRCYNGVL